MKNFLIIIFLLELSISQNDIIIDTESCSPCTDPNAACASGTGCECNTGYRLNQEYSTCISDTSTIITGTDGCDDSTNACSDTNSECTSGTGCVCKAGYRLNNDNTACVQNTASIITGTNSCTAPCADSHATCTVGTGCKCNDGYQLNTGRTACEQTTVTPTDIITGTESCTASAGCQDTHATCAVGTGCKCNDGYQLNTGRTACEQTTVTPTTDIITGTESCTAAAGCQDTHATCTVGTGCKCNDAYQLKQDKSGCEAKSDSGSGTGSGTNESGDDDSSSFLKYSLLAVLSLLF